MTRQPKRQEDAFKRGDNALYIESGAMYEGKILFNKSDSDNIAYRFEFGRMINKGMLPQIPDGLVCFISKKRNVQYHSGIWRLESVLQRK